MNRLPRLLPLIGVAAAGLLAVNALAGAGSLPELLGPSQARAESAKPAAKPAAAAPKPAAPAAKPAAKAAVCAPTAAQLAEQAGLSPAELRILQSLGARRGQLDKREQDLSTQLALMAAAEQKLDAKIKALNGLKGEIQSLVVQADQQQESEVDRLVSVYEKMKPKAAAPIMAAMDDKVRLPVAGRMKEQALALILAQMPPAEAKALTEKLAARFESEALAAKIKKAAEGARAQANAAPPKPAAPAKRGA